MVSEKSPTLSFWTGLIDWTAGWTDKHRSLHRLIFCNANLKKILSTLRKPYFSSTPNLTELKAFPNEFGRGVGVAINMLQTAERERERADQTTK